MLMMPLYEQVKQEILKRINNQYWNPGDSLPNEFELADELGVSQGTIRKALSILTEEKVLERRQGKGTFVAKVDFQRFWKHKTVHGADQVEYTQYITLEKIPMPDFVKNIFGDENTECIMAKRIHHMGEGVLLYKVLYIQLEQLQDFDTIGENPDSMGKFLDNHFDSVFRNNLYASTNHLKAVMPDEECQKYLNIGAFTPVLLQQYTINDAFGNCCVLGYLYCDSTQVFYEDIVS